MEKLVNDFVGEFEAGKISRRELVSRMTGLTAAVALTSRGATAQDGSDTPPFQATGVNHIALRVTNVQQSRDFYVKHLGLTVTRDSPLSCFLTMDNGFVALFQGDEPRMDHYCFSIDNYDVDAVTEKLEDLGLAPERQGDRVYFKDPDGLTVQLAAKEHTA